MPLVLLLLVLAGLYWTAWVEMTIWNWVMPVMFHLPALTLSQGIMLSVVVGYLLGTHRLATRDFTLKDEDKADVATKFAHHVSVIFGPGLLALGTVWLALKFQ